MDKKQIEILIEKIKAANTILIFGHKNPDGDSAGAVLGMAHLIRDNFSKTADVAYDGNYPINLDFLPGRTDIWYVEKLIENKSMPGAPFIPAQAGSPVPKYDLFIAVDMGSRIQLGDYGSRLFDAAMDSVKIDHHKTADWNANLDFVYAAASSACEIIFDIARSANWRVGADTATCLCAGIYYDTGMFSFVDTSNNKPLLDAAELINLGASLRDISEGVNISTRKDVMAQADVLSHAEFFYNGKLAVALISNKHYKHLDSGQVEIIWNLRNIKGVECVAVLKEARIGEVGLSLRSRSIVVRPIAEKFGGGGHDLAAGGKICAGLEDAKKLIVAEFKNVIPA